jgi:hypothetical protein
MRMLKYQLMDYRSHFILPDRTEDRSLPKTIFKQPLGDWLEAGFSDVRANSWALLDAF